MPHVLTFEVMAISSWQVVRTRLERLTSAAIRRDAQPCDLASSPFAPGSFSLMTTASAVVSTTVPVTSSPLAKTRFRRVPRGNPCTLSHAALCAPALALPRSGWQPRPSLRRAAGDQRCRKGLSDSLGWNRHDRCQNQHECLSICPPRPVVRESHSNRLNLLTWRPRPQDNRPGVRRHPIGTC